MSYLLVSLSAWLFAYCVILAAIMGLGISPIITLIVLAALLLKLFKKGNLNLSAFGTARLSEEKDLRKNGLLGAKQGLIIGRLPCTSWLKGLLGLLTNNSRWACNRFLEAWQGKGELVRLPNAVHTAVFAPTGVGKGVSCVIPFLMSCEESCVVIDFKGELATLTAEHRRRMGHEIVILDPYKVVTS